MGGRGSGGAIKKLASIPALGNLVPAGREAAEAQEEKEGNCVEADRGQGHRREAESVEPG